MASQKSGGNKKKKRTPRTSRGLGHHPKRLGRNTDPMTRLLNQLNAYKKGKRTMVTIDGCFNGDGRHETQRILGDIIFKTKGFEKYAS